MVGLFICKPTTLSIRRRPEPRDLSSQPQLRKVADLHSPVRKMGNDAQLAAHGFDVTAQR